MLVRVTAGGQRGAERRRSLAAARAENARGVVRVRGSAADQERAFLGAGAGARSCLRLWGILESAMRPIVVCPFQRCEPPKGASCDREHVYSAGIALLFLCCCRHHHRAASQPACHPPACKPASLCTCSACATHLTSPCFAARPPAHSARILSDRPPHLQRRSAHCSDTAANFVQSVRGSRWCPAPTGTLSAISAPLIQN